MNHFEELDGAGLRKLLETEARAVLVDFWGPWCGPCRALRPHLAKMALEREEDWCFVAVNTEEHEDVAEAFAVSSLPTLALFKAGREVGRLSGGITLGAVAEKLDEFGDRAPMKLEG